MRALSDAHHFRKLVAGTCMVLSPLFVLAAGIVQPDSKLDEAGQLATVAGNPDAWYLAQMLGLVAIVLAVPAVLGLMHMLREREVAFGHVGGGLSLIGLLGYMGLTSLALVQWQMVAGGSSAQMTDLLHRLNHTTGVAVPFALGIVAFGVGLICLAIGLYRAKAVHSWMALALSGAAACIAVASFTASSPLFVAGAALLVVALGSIGWMVIGESDADWEHTPEYEGFRPLAGMR
jgi:hypothetical protein